MILDKLIGMFSSDMAIDLGTANTIIKHPKLISNIGLGQFNLKILIIVRDY